MDTNGNWTKSYTDSLIPFPYCLVFDRPRIMKRPFVCRERRMDQFIIYLHPTFLWKFISISYVFLMKGIYYISNIEMIQPHRLYIVSLAYPKFVSYKRVSIEMHHCYVHGFLTLCSLFEGRESINHQHTKIDFYSFYHISAWPYVF